MDTRLIPQDTFLMHVREFKETDLNFNAFNYPTWYFTKTTPFLYVQSKQPEKNDQYYVPNSKRFDIDYVLQAREIERTERLREHMQSLLHKSIEVKDPLFKDFVKPLAICNAHKLEIDIFKVTRDLPVFFLLTPGALLRTSQITKLNEAIHTIDHTFTATQSASLVEPSQWLFQKSQSAGLIIPAVYPEDIYSINEIFLTQRAVPYLGFAGTVTVTKYLDYAKQFRY